MDDMSTKENILKTLLYYHIFNHPLTQDEIYFFHQNTKMTKQKLKKALREIVSEKDSTIGELNGLYYVMPNKNHAEERIKKEHISSKSWKKAKIASLFIKQFPFIRGIFVTGTLSKNSSVVNSDIDFLIVCKEKRLWIARTLLRLFSRIFMLNRYLCVNYVISEENLHIDDQNIFTATELAYIKVMYNTEMLNQFIRSNKWIEQYFPLYPASNGMYHFPSPDFRTKDKQSYFQLFLEKFFPGKIGDRIDDFLHQLTQRRVNKKFANYAEREQKKSLKLTAGAAKLHGGDLGDHKLRVLDKYYALLRQYQIFDPNECNPAALHNV